MASGKRSGFGGWDKGYCDVGLGLKIQRQQHQQHQQQQQQPNETFSSGASMREMMPWQHGRSDYTASEHNNCSTTSSSRSPSPSTSFISGFPQTTSFFSNQDGVLAASDHHSRTPPSRFGEGTRVVFTAGQRQELERQTIIYKYMMASMPVPPELLVPLSKYPSSEEVGRRAGKNGLELRYTSTNSGRGGGGDAEPWRCRRTDGKKWRCSRDVAPDQKYCERHSHKGRPSRSRKPVESLVISPLPNSNIKPPSSSASSASNSTIFSPFNKPSSFDLPSHLSHYTTQPSRFPEWFMKKEVLPATLYPGQIEQFGGDIREGDGDATHFDSKRAVTDQTCMLPRPFIDAWSLGDVHKDANPTSTSNAVTLALPTEVTTSKDPTSSRINSVLPLTLSMSAGIDYDSIHDTPKDHVIRDARSSHQQPLNWMTSWIGSPPGGPLAEALCLGISGNAGGLAAHSDDLVSPHGHSTGSSTTTMGSKSSNASVETSGQGFHLH